MGAHLWKFSTNPLRRHVQAHEILGPKMPQPEQAGTIPWLQRFQKQISCDHHDNQTQTDFLPGRCPAWRAWARSESRGTLQLVSSLGSIKPPFWTSDGEPEWPSINLLASCREWIQSEDWGWLTFKAAVTGFSDFGDGPWAFRLSSSSICTGQQWNPPSLGEPPNTSSSKPGSPPPL